MNNSPLPGADKATDELLPCPFCGGKESFVERLDYSAAYVQCDSSVGLNCACMARGPVAVQDDDGEEIPGTAGAIAAWNRRAALAARQAPDTSLAQGAGSVASDNEFLRQLHNKALEWAASISKVRASQLWHELLEIIDARLARTAPNVESAIDALVAALQESKGWMRDYADSIVRDAIARTAAPSEYTTVQDEHGNWDWKRNTPPPSEGRAIPTDGDTGNPEADQIIDRLMSSDPDFQDCTNAAGLIRRLIIENKGPDGFKTWQEAAVSERVRRVKAESARRPAVVSEGQAVAGYLVRRERAWLDRDSYLERFTAWRFYKVEDADDLRKNELRGLYGPDIHHFQPLYTRPAAPAPEAPTDLTERQKAVMLHDFPKLAAFFHKHALGPMLAPSCLVCGCLPQAVAIRHGELPGIVVCAACRDKALATPATEQAPTKDSGEGAGS